MRVSTPSGFFILLFLLYLPNVLYTQEPFPKQEFRAVWLTTAFSLDWPPNAPTDVQKEALRNIIKTSKNIGLNTIVFQAVARGDAMYQSERLPWAASLTGTPGKDPGWDPLAFLIEEAQALGMEVHAWYNVFYVGDGSTPRSSTSDPPHIVYSHPEWIRTVDDRKFLNPGYPDARAWAIENVLELVENYDIDAIHFDYIRYASGGFTDDWQLFAEYNPEDIDNLHDWRRYNVNEFVRDSYPAIKNIKPWMKIGSTPVGHYGTADYPHFSGYYHAYQDSRRWLEEEVHDYLAPQLYWDIGKSGDDAQFELLAHEWIQASSGRHVYIGMGPYKTNVYPEIPAQIDTVRKAGGDGQIYFRYNHITPPPPFGDRYQYMSLPPVMEYNDLTVPDPVVSFSFDRHPELPVSVLQWDEPVDAPAGGIRNYVLYRFDYQNVTDDDLQDPSNIYDVTGNKEYSPDASDEWGTNFVLTNLSRNNVESAMSQVVEIPQPLIPELAMPVNESASEPDTVQLTWNFTDRATHYYLELSQDEDFSKIVIAKDEYQDTVLNVTGLEGQSRYYWRVKTSNAAGISEYSQPFSFRTAFPASPLLAFPDHATEGVSVTPELIWYADTVATEYQFQLATTRGFTEATTVYDTTGVLDTTLVVPMELDSDQIYFWRVSGKNEYGTSLWSDAWGFRTEIPTFVGEQDGIPENFALRQNYPNPFNPATTIEFSLPEEEHVTLVVYDVLGREVAELFNDRAMPGTYRVEFNASSLPSGVYLYRIQSDSFTETKRMMYLK